MQSKLSKSYRVIIPFTKLFNANVNKNRKNRKLMSERETPKYGSKFMLYSLEELTDKLLSLSRNNCYFSKCLQVTLYLHKVPREWS